MCRWLCYHGPSIYLEKLIYEPSHSLIDQSLHAEEAKVETNADGFGVAWYTDRSEPGLYRDILPAWSDSNLRSLAHHIKANVFLAHVRASTGTETSRPNCHPFTQGRWTFMHNGQIGEYLNIRRQLEALISDELYRYRLGTTDSEAIFLIMLSYGLDVDPEAAICKTIKAIMGIMETAHIKTPFRFTASLTDGERLYAIRFSTDNNPATLYYTSTPESLTVVSEPLDDTVQCWISVPASHILKFEGSFSKSKNLTISPLNLI